MANKFKSGERGSVLLEFTLVIPLLLTFVLGTIDLALLMMNWSSLNRATYSGARFAAISDPVATGINNAIAGTTGATAGQSCINANTGASSGKCTITGSTCTATGVATGSTCSNNFTASDAALDAIVAEMNRVLVGMKLDRRQVSVTYTPTNIGFVNRPGGSPMNITVSIRCARNEFYFLTGIMRWVFAAPVGTCAGIGVQKGVALPAFSTTLPSEDLTTN